MSYRERSIFSHRVATSKISAAQDAIPGDLGPVRGKKNSGTKEKSRPKEKAGLPVKPAIREKPKRHEKPTHKETEEKERDKRRAVTAIGSRDAGRTRKAETLDPKKRLKGKKASRPSTQMKKEALEQPELQEIYASEEVVIPPSPPARVNPYQKYQDLIDELNRKYDHEQSLEKIYHRHIEYSVDMGAQGRDRRRGQTHGALSRADAVTTSTMVDADLEGITSKGGLTGGQSVLELRYEGDDQEEGERLESVNTESTHFASTDDIDFAIASDGTGECDDSSVGDDSKSFADFEPYAFEESLGKRSSLGNISVQKRNEDDVSATGEQSAPAFDPYRTVTFDDFEAFARTSLASGVGAGDVVDTRATSETSMFMEDTAPLLSEVLNWNDDAAEESEEDTDQVEDDDVAAVGSSIACSEEVVSSEDEERSDREDADLEESAVEEDQVLEEALGEESYELEEDGGMGIGEELGDQVGSDLESDVDVGIGAGDSLASEEQECDFEKKEISEPDVGLVDADDAVDAGRPEGKSTTSLATSVLTSPLSREDAVEPPLEGGKLPALGAVADVRRASGLKVSLEGSRFDGLVDGDLGGSYQRAQQQIAELQAQVAVLRAGKVEEAHRRVRAATWMRHVAYVESRLRAELLEVDELWRRLQPLSAIARHWEDEDKADWPLQEACGLTREEQAYPKALEV